MISLLVGLPALAGDDLVWPAIVVFGLCVGLDLDAVEVLVESVEEIGDELSGVVLVVA